jgi:hypothetical protein
MSALVGHWVIRKALPSFSQFTRRAPYNHESSSAGTRKFSIFGKFLVSSCAFPNGNAVPLGLYQTQNHFGAPLPQLRALRSGALAGYDLVHIASVHIGYNMMACWLREAVTEWRNDKRLAPAQFGCCVKEKMLLSYFLPRGGKWTLSSANFPVKFWWQRRTKSAMVGRKKWKREGKQKCLRLNMNYTCANRGEGHELMTILWENFIWWPICERIWFDDHFVR